ncbi:MAG: 5-deoxy-glucuronate isomerase [Acetivibrionales bacterium]|jgi:5-deoxy-glucuronate isomerase
MIVRQCRPFEIGYNAITELNGLNSEAQMDFGIVKLIDGYEYVSMSADKERAFILIEGEARLEWQGRVEQIKRKSFLDENPFCLHVPKGIEVKITGINDAELAVQAVYNNNSFEPVFYSQEDCQSDNFGEGVLNNTSLRVVRTVFDDDNAPYSNMVLGEVINYPGRWSSYPPHHHKQPEVYHYRFFPSQGFGISEHGEDISKVYNNDTAVIPGGYTHMQVSAPGYAMYYIWGIPHIKEKRWQKDRHYLQRDEWMLEPGVKIWPEK